MSPTIFREKGYRFYFFSREETRMHVHAYCVNGEAKSRCMLKIAKIVKNAEIRVDDGKLRDLTIDEKVQLSKYLCFPRGRRFWALIISGILIVMITFLVLKYYELI